MFVGAKSTIALSVLVGALSGCVALTGIDSFHSDKASSESSSAPNVAAPGSADAPPKNAAASASPTDPGSGPSPPTRPLAGVYTYDITGGDQLKGIFNFKATYGPTAQVKIEDDGDHCFKQTITLREGYDESMSECIVGLEIVQSSGVRAQKFPLVGTVTTLLTCAPGDAYFGTDRSTASPWNHICTGRNSDDKSGDSAFLTAGPYAFVAPESVSIKGIDVPVFHFHDDRTVSQGQAGTNVADWYFSADGLLVKLVRNVSIDYPSPIGKVTYLETATLTLSELPH